MKAIRVKFKPVGKRYFFGTAGYDLKDQDLVVVNTIRGLELGYCSGEVFELQEKDLTSELKDIVRVANKQDIEAHEKNRLEEPKIIKKDERNFQGTGFANKGFRGRIHFR